MEEKLQEIDIKLIPLEARPNISVQDMKKYKNGGLALESKGDNGAMVYIPYGIYVDIFRAIRTGAFSIRKEMSYLCKMRNEYMKFANNEEMGKGIQDSFDDRIRKIEYDLDILEQIISMANEV